ncbi:unnamed protein product [Urochloa humidicola]
MIGESKKIVLEWDLKHWPQFNKLKTLLLNDCWCVAPDFHALTCIFQNSPLNFFLRNRNIKWKYLEDAIQRRDYQLYHTTPQGNQSQL